MKEKDIEKKKRKSGINFKNKTCCDWKSNTLQIAKGLISNYSRIHLNIKQARA